MSSASVVEPLAVNSHRLANVSKWMSNLKVYSLLSWSSNHIAAHECCQYSTNYAADATPMRSFRTFDFGCSVRLATQIVLAVSPTRSSSNGSVAKRPQLSSLSSEVAAGCFDDDDAIAVGSDDDAVAAGGAHDDNGRSFARDDDTHSICDTHSRSTWRTQRLTSRKCRLPVVGRRSSDR